MKTRLPKKWNIGKIYCFLNKGLLFSCYYSKKTCFPIKLETSNDATNTSMLLLSSESWIFQFLLWQRIRIEMIWSLPGEGGWSLTSAGSWGGRLLFLHHHGSKKNRLNLCQVKLFAMLLIWCLRVILSVSSRFSWFVAIIILSCLDLGIH